MPNATLTDKIQRLYALLTRSIKRLYSYYAYFGCAVGDQDGVWSPRDGCLDCSGKLGNWFTEKK